jgi:hypothetical protein
MLIIWTWITSTTAGHWSGSDLGLHVRIKAQGQGIPTNPTMLRTGWIEVEVFLNP